MEFNEFKEKCKQYKKLLLQGKTKEAKEFYKTISAQGKSISKYFILNSYMLANSLNKVFEDKKIEYKRDYDFGDGKQYNTYLKLSNGENYIINVLVKKKISCVNVSALYLPTNDVIDELIKKYPELEDLLWEQVICKANLKRESQLRDLDLEVMDVEDMPQKTKTQKKLVNELLEKLNSERRRIRSEMNTIDV